MKFGNYSILSSTVHTFEKNPEWTWTINPPTAGHELKLEKYLVQKRLTISPDGTRSNLPATNLEIAMREISLTFGGTNITDEDGKPVLADNASIEEIEAILEQMHYDMVMEIWSAVGDATIEWGPKKDPKNEKSAKPS